MSMRTVVFALILVPLSRGMAVAQTSEIQKKVEKKLGELRKEKLPLEELLEEALKNNADIRVAESKVRDAEMSLYRSRMQILEKVAILYHEIRAAKAACAEANVRCKSDQVLYDKGALSAAELSITLAKRDKLKSDWDRLGAQMEFLTGKQNARALLYYPPAAVNVTRTKATDISFTMPAQAATADKIRKALDQPFTVNPKERIMPTSELPALLRKHTEGVNVIKDFNGANEVEAPVKLPFHEAIPVGALYQWVEDQLNWRFIIRDYGIVAVDRNTAPPGAVLLLDFWHKGKATAAPK
jgi:hypothetical protein